MPFTLTMPKLSPTMTEGTIVKWHKKIGDVVKAGDVLIEVATDKASVEYNALDGGCLRQILVEAGTLAEVNQPIAIFSESPDEDISAYTPEDLRAPKKTNEVPSEKEETVLEEAPKEASSTIQAPSFAPEAPLEDYQFPFHGKGSDSTFASPLAKKIAEEKGVDLSSIKGSGPRGRIMSYDLDVAPSRPWVSRSGSSPKMAPGSYEEEPLSPLRKVIAQRVSDAKTFIPHIYVRQTVNPESFLALREELKAAGVKITVNDLMIRAVALALKEHPEVNSGYHVANEVILRFKTIDISVAVTVEGGVITPIIRHADYKSVGEISAEMKELSRRAKEQKLEPHEYKGGSFTISNLGMTGVTDFCAVINPPQTAILAVGGLEEKVRFREGSTYMGKELNLVLSADHRVLDGLEAAKFLQTLKKLLENPSVLILG